MNTSCGSVVPIYRTYHTACWKETAEGQTAANSKVTSGPKYCEGEQTTAQPGGETDSMRVMSYNLYGWNALVQNPWKAENVYKAIREINPDLLGAQESEGREAQVAAAIGSDCGRHSRKHRKCMKRVDSLCRENMDTGSYKHAVEIQPELLL